MKKAVVVGGSNGIGLAISKNLIDKGYHICIIDKSIPDEVAQLEILQYTFLLWSNGFYCWFSQFTNVFCVCCFKGCNLSLC